MNGLHELREMIEAAPASDLPGLLGELEQLKALAWVRLTTPSTPAPSTPAALVGAAEMAAMLGVAEHWVREKGRAGLIPTVELGHYVRFEPGAVVEAVRRLRLSGQSHNPSLRRIEKPQQNQRQKRPLSKECPKSSGWPAKGRPTHEHREPQVPRGKAGLLGEAAKKGRR